MADETTTYQMTNARPENYWIAPDALYITLNAMGQPDYLQGNVSSGAVIMCYMRGIDGLSFDAGHNYRRWPLAVSPTYFNTSTPKYVYAAIPKSEAVNAYAQIVYPSEKIDLYGKNEKGEQIGAEGYYFVFLQGIISASVATDGTTQMRSWTQRVDCGSLASDEAIAAGGTDAWWKYSSVDDTVTFLKTIAKAVFDNITAKIATISKLVLGGKPLTGVAEYPKTSSASETDVVTPKYVSDRGEKEYLSKTKDDTAAGQITFDKGFISKEWGIFNNGWKTGTYDGNTVYDHGAMVDENGNGILNSLFVRQFVSAPKFVFNEVNVTKSEQWNTNAYGTIEKVDTEKREITLHLEENDYGSVEVGDICRGIFADIDDTYNSSENGEGSFDHCGFVVHRGFFTTYFTVEKIIVNRRGICVFQYQKRTDNTPDPCPYMDFAQYGSFIDKDRRSSMYLSSRGHSYIEVLDGVSTWEIQPENRVCRYGWLGNLTIRNDDGTYQTLEGNGLFAQNHVYFGGDIIKLSNISDLDDLQKMAGAYDISLSRYQGVITVDDLGNVIGGLYSISDSGIKQYKLSTAVYVRKGNDILLEEDDTTESVTEGHYRVTASSDDCTVEIKNSAVYIKSIKNIRDGESDTEEDIDYDAMRKVEACKVTIYVELEGKTTKIIEFPIRVVHDPLPFLDCDLDNEHASVCWNTKAKMYTGFPIKSVATLLYHNNPWQIDKDSHVGGLPDGLKADISFADKKMAISITTDGKKIGDFLAKKEGEATVTTHNLSIHIIGTYAGARYEYSKLLTIDRRADTTVYEIIPSSDSIIMDKDKTLSVNSLSCEVWATSSDDKRYKVDDLSAAGLEVKYCKGEGTPNLAFGTSVSVTKNDKSVTLGLFNKTTGEILDKETVPIVAWGEDGKGVEFIYFRSKDAQTVFDNYKPDEWFTDVNYQGGSESEYIGEIQKKYPNWTDDPQGIDPEHPFEYVSIRKSVNGVWGKFSKPAIYASIARSIKSINTYYAIVPQDKVGTKPSDSDFTHDELTDVVISDNKGKWLWSADKVEYSDGSTPEYLNKTCLGACEELANVTEQYGVSTDPSVQPSAPYDASGAYPTNLKEGDCIWSRDHIVWLNNSSSDTDWQFIGKIGVDGDGVTSTEIAYGSSMSDQTLPTSWYSSQSQVTINDTYCWFWTRTIWHYKKSADRTAYTKSYKGKDGDAVTYYEARFSEQRAAVYVEKDYETGYVGVKFRGSFYLVEGDNSSKASGSGLGLKLEFLNEAGTVIVTRTASVNGSSFSYNNSSKTDIQSNYRNQDDNKITSCRYTVTCNDGRDTKSGIIPIGFNAGSVFYHTDERFESLLQNDKGYSELTQTVDGICTHVQRLETNLLMGSSTGTGWTKDVSSDASYFSFNEATRQFDLVNYYPAFRSGYSGASYSTLKSPIVRIEKNKKYIISFNMDLNSKVGFFVGVRFGSANECSNDARYITWANNIEPDDSSNKKEGVIYRSKTDSSRYFVIIETNTSSYEYMQVLFINAVSSYETSTSNHVEDYVTIFSAWPYSSTSRQTLSSSTTISDGDTVKTTKVRNAYYTGSSTHYAEETDVTTERVEPVSTSVSKIQMELASRDAIADIEPSSYKESQNAIESYIKQTADSIEIRASKIIFKGETVINGKFVVDEDGNVTLNYLTANNATINGVINAESGKIGGWQIDGASLKSDGQGAAINIEQDGYNFARFGNIGEKSFLYVRMDKDTSMSGHWNCAATFNTYGSNGTALSLLANSKGYALESYGRVNLCSRNAESVLINHLALKTDSNTDSFDKGGAQLVFGKGGISIENESFSPNVIITSRSYTNISLPANPNKGDLRIVVQGSSDKVTITDPNGHWFQHGNETARTSVNSDTNGQWTFFLYDGFYWQTVYCNGRPW